MKRFWLSIMAALLIAAVMTPAYAWEFSMSGEFVYRMQYFSRTGQKDIFGEAGLQDIPGAVLSTSGAAATVYQTNNAGWIGFAGPNIYENGWINPGAPRTIMQDNAPVSGVAITRGGFSRWGCDAWIGDQRLTINPAIRVNNAIRLHGTYTVGGLRQKYAQRRVDAAGEFSPGAAPFERYYMHHSSDAAYNTAGIGSWEQVRATIQLPIATLSIGIKDFPFGSGAFFAQNVRSDSLLAVVPYGPFRLLFAIWPGLGTRAGVSTSYDTHPDKETKYTYRYGPLVTYESGPLWMGGGAILGSYHRDSAYSANAGFGEDVNQALWAAAMKFTNGRFFLNIDWATTLNDTYKVKQTAALGNIATAAPVHNEGYVWFSEAGVLAGPAKLSLMYASVSGPVWNNFGAASSNTFRQVKTYGGNTVNYQVLEPYSFLMFPTYGGGNNTFNPDGTGQMSDAFCFAGRLDYAVAANLNIFGSYIWAHRLENAGTYAGQYYASSNAANYNVAVNDANANALIGLAQAFKGGGAATNPYVDDGFIGWEAQGGVSWKLLEGMTMDFAYAYWNLGQWFDQAYRAFTYNAAGGQYGNGLMQGRDPIHSLRGSFTINF